MEGLMAIAIGIVIGPILMLLYLSLFSIGLLETEEEWYNRKAREAHAINRACYKD